MKSRPRPDEAQLPVRITVVGPPPDVAFCVQRRRTERLHPSRASAREVSFDFVLRVRRGGRSDGGANFLGPFTQGSIDDRFVYVGSGTFAGQADSPWDRRAKVPLNGVPEELLEETLARPGSRLECRIAGLAKDGGPACATVPLLDPGWFVTR